MNNFESKQKIAEIKINMPPDLLAKSPEELDKWLLDQSNLAFKKGTEQIQSIKEIAAETTPESSPAQQAKALIAEAKKATAELLQGLSKEGVKIPKPEILAEESQEQKEKAKRLRFLGELTVKLLPGDQKLAQLLSGLKPDSITGDQERQIQNAEKEFQAEFEKAELTEEEKIQVIGQLKNFREAKKALLNFNIDRAEKLLQMNVKAKKAGRMTISAGSVTPRNIKLQEDKNISNKRKEIENLKKELEKYDLAA